MNFINQNILTYLLSTIYGSVMDMRNWLFYKGILPSHRFDVPTIGVGNLAVGGTGKTPHVEYLLRMLNDKYKTAVLSRGYGRKTKSFQIADQNSSAYTIGDESFQIFSKFPNTSVFVDEKRVHGVEEILKVKPHTEVILLDDAYQHRYISPGLSILLTDIKNRYTRDHVMPFGYLREKRKNANRADIIIVTKCPLEIAQEEIRHILQEIEPTSSQSVFFSGMQYEDIFSVYDLRQINKERLSKSDILVVTAIAHPQPMVKHVEKLAKSIETLTFADHHLFSKNDIRTIEKKSKDKIIIITEKDAARIKSIDYLNEKLKKKIYVLPMKVKILNNQEEEFNQKINDYVRTNSRNS